MNTFKLTEDNILRYYMTENVEIIRDMEGEELHRNVSRSAAIALQNVDAVEIHRIMAENVPIEFLGWIYTMTAVSYEDAIINVDLDGVQPVPKSS